MLAFAATVAPVIPSVAAVLPIIAPLKDIEAPVARIDVAIQAFCAVLRTHVATVDRHRRNLGGNLREREAGRRQCAEPHSRVLSPLRNACRERGCAARQRRDSVGCRHRG